LAGLRAKRALHEGSGVDVEAALASRDLWDFDDRVVAPLNGFDGADDYYARSSSPQFLGRIHTPTLILHSADDPFMTAEVLPREDELSEAVTLEVSERGATWASSPAASPVGLAHRRSAMRITTHSAVAGLNTPTDLG
jgi:predicted alpha/beta-fold hydrolase